MKVGQPPRSGLVQFRIPIFDSLEILIWHFKIERTIKMADTKQTTLTKTNDDIQEISIKSAEFDIKSMIYVIRNQQVMIDSDLAMLYHVETRVLNQAVKRNISRFPERFRFQLTKEEYENLKSQFVISSLEDDNGYGGRRKLPFVFTEQGIAMLSAVLRSDVAVGVSIRIMDTFVEMWKYIIHGGMDIIKKEKWLEITPNIKVNILIIMLLATFI